MARGLEVEKKSKIVSEYDQEIPQSQTADNPVAPRGRAAQPSRSRSQYVKRLQVKRFGQLLFLIFFSTSNPLAIEICFSVDSQIVRAKKNLKLSHGGSSYR